MPGRLRLPHVAVLLALALGGHGLAQRVSTVKDRCTLKAHRSPTIRGFKLGVIRAQAEKAFGGSINYVAYKENSTGAASVASHQYPQKLPDVTSIKMNFFKERLYATRSYMQGATSPAGRRSRRTSARPGSRRPRRGRAIRRPTVSAAGRCTPNARECACCTALAGEWPRR